MVAFVSTMVVLEIAVRLAVVLSTMTAVSVVMDSNVIDLVVELMLVILRLEFEHF